MACASVVVFWTRVYTAGLPAAIRDRRREEIGADVREQLEDARSRHERPATTAALLISRMARGAWHDVSWRREVSRPVRLARWQGRRGWWIATAVLITLAAVTVWLSYGLSLRSGGDREPLQLAASTAKKLTSGSRPDSVMPPLVNIATARAPFVIVYDSEHHVLASSGRLDGGTPGLPAGVLAWVATHGQDRITWQPEPGNREATVVKPYGGPHPGFVLAARSLRHVSAEQRTLTWMIACIWLAALAISFLTVKLAPGRTRSDAR